MYVINSIDPGLDECKDSNEQVNHYFYFNIIDKYIRVKNNKDPKRYYLNCEYLSFEELNCDYSEWIIENINGNRIVELFMILLKQILILINPNKEILKHAGLKY